MTRYNEKQGQTNYPEDKKIERIRIKMFKKLIWIVTFTGKRNDWRQWSKKIVVVAEKREYRIILETDKEELEVRGDYRKKKNSAAYNDLLLATTDDVSFGQV